jgi:hypothetical protein
VKPIRIFRHEDWIQPGRLIEYLAAHNLPWQMVRIDQGEKVPQSIDNVSGLVFLGGTMSVNDGHDWLAKEIELIRLAAAEGLPMLGHCLGSQLIAKILGIYFENEFRAVAKGMRTFYPQVRTVFEMGGETSKYIRLEPGATSKYLGITDYSTSGDCAAGTGSFIDQMASLLSLSVPELDELYAEHQQIYNIASRCGVFAKSDIQPLLNQGANKADIAASIYQAIVGQTIAGLAQGRELKGRIAFLGGPLTFLSGLRDRFVKTLKLRRRMQCSRRMQNFMSPSALRSATRRKPHTLLMN